jgi:hypothetical protein
MSFRKIKRDTLYTDRLAEAKTLDYEAVFNYFQSWITKFNVNGRAYGGSGDLTNDWRINKLNELYNLKDKRVLELGALEGAHSLMLSRLGARQVVSIEGRPENFIKCCCVKNLFDLQSVRFVLEDVNAVTREAFGNFDVIVAIGILYHVGNPAQVLHNLSEMTSRLFIWTHYSDDSYPDGGVRELALDGRSYAGKIYREGGLKDPLAGLEANSFWPFEQELYRMIEDVGFSVMVLNKGSLAHAPVGAKHCTLFATKE